MKKRVFLIAGACAAIVLIGGLVRYAEREAGTDKPRAAVTIAPGSSVDARGKMTVDGQEEDVQDSCSAPAAGGSVNISLSGESPTMVNVVLDNAQPPNVSSVVLAVSGMGFLYQPGQEAGKEGGAAATKDGNTYHITGSVVRYEFVIKPFDITVTCG